MVLMVFRTVGRGPVPRHAWVDRSVAGDRPPRYEKNRSRSPDLDPFVIRRSQTTEGGKQKNGARALPPLPCRSRSPDLDPFVIRRSQTTEGGTRIVTIEIAGDRQPPYVNIATRGLSYRGAIEPRGLSYRQKSSPEVSPTGKTLCTRNPPYRQEIAFSRKNKTHFS